MITVKLVIAGLLGALIFMRESRPQPVPPTEYSCITVAQGRPEIGAGIVSWRPDVSLFLAKDFREVLEFVRNSTGSVTIQLCGEGR